MLREQCLSILLSWDRFDFGRLLLSQRYLWRGPSLDFLGIVRTLKYTFFQERGGNNSFTHEALTLKYKLDNQFELVFVVSGDILEG